MELIERLMNGDEEIEFELPPDFEKQLRSLADEMHKKLEDMVSYILQVTAGSITKTRPKKNLSVGSLFRLKQQWSRRTIKHKS